MYCHVSIIVLWVSRDLVCEFVPLAKIPYQDPKTTKKVFVDQVDLCFTRIKTI